MKMPLFVLATFIATSTALPVQALTHKYPCDELVFDALTKTGDKRIQLCKSGHKINYNFGPMNGKSELDVLVPIMSVVLHTNQYSRNLDPAIELFRGDYSYTVYPDILLVSKSEIRLADIPLKKPIYNNLMEGLLPFGVPITQRPFTFSSYIKDIENVTQHQPV